MMETAGTASGRRAFSFALFVLVFAVAELQALSLLYDYQTGFGPACMEAFGRAACSLFGYAVPRGLGLAAALVLFAIARPELLRRLVAAPAPVPRGFALNLGGFALLALPALMLSGDTLAAAFLVLLPVWLAGALLAGLGLLAMIADAGTWTHIAAENRGVLAVLAVLGLLTPELAQLLGPIWQIEAIADVTSAP